MRTIQVDDAEQIRAIVSGTASSSLVQVICGLRSVRDGSRRIEIIAREGEEPVLAQCAPMAMDLAIEEFNRRMPR